MKRYQITKRKGHLTSLQMAELNKLSERKLPYEYALASFIQDGRVKEPGNA